MTYYGYLPSRKVAVPVVVSSCYFAKHAFPKFWSSGSFSAKRTSLERHCFFHPIVCTTTNQLLAVVSAAFTFRLPASARHLSLHDHPPRREQPCGLSQPSRRMSALTQKTALRGARSFATRRIPRSPLRACAPDLRSSRATAARPRVVSVSLQARSSHQYNHPQYNVPPHNNGPRRATRTLLWYAAANRSNISVQETVADHRMRSGPLH